MRIARFLHEGRTLEGVLGPDDVLVAEGGTLKVPLADVELLPPCEPTKLVCVGRNYVEHAAELGNEVPEEPLIFLKPPSAVIPSGAEIRYPSWSKLLHFEGELAVVIGRRCRNVSAFQARDVIRGYTVMNDVTARDRQKEDKTWTRGKAFDASAPLGPWLETELDPDATRVRTWVNGELRQDGETSLMVFRVPHLVATISRIMTLEPGDVIATGTPAGVGEIRVGDTVEIEVDGIGRLANAVAAADDAQLIE